MHYESAGNGIEALKQRHSAFELFSISLHPPESFRTGKVALVGWLRFDPPVRICTSHCNLLEEAGWATSQIDQRHCQDCNPLAGDKRVAGTKTH
jgi:hypothetical protein